MPYYFSAGTFAGRLAYQHLQTCRFESLLSYYFLTELMTPVVGVITQSTFSLGVAQLQQSGHLHWCFWVAIVVDLACPVHSVPFFWVGS